MNKTMRKSAKRDGVLYARVPMGNEACGFCIMLASRGFAYSSANAAGEGNHYHANCRCKVIPGFPGMRVDGYDPDGMGRRYDECLAALGGRNGLRRDWSAMPEEERRAFIEKHGVRGSRAKTAKGKRRYYKRVDNGQYRSESRAFTAYVNKRIAQEIETRDSEWFTLGKTITPEVIPGATPNKREWKAARRLCEAGWRPLFRPTRDKEMLKTSDVFFLSGPKDNPVKTQWEFKCPVGGGSQTLYHQLEEAAGQSTRGVIDLRNAQPGKLESREYVESKISKLIWYTYTIERGANKGKDWHYDEVIVIFMNGDIRKIARH